MKRPGTVLRFGITCKSIRASEPNEISRGLSVGLFLNWKTLRLSSYTIPIHTIFQQDIFLPFNWPNVDTRMNTCITIFIDNHRLPTNYSSEKRKLFNFKSTNTPGERSFPITHWSGWQTKLCRDGLTDGKTLAANSITPATFQFTHHTRSFPFLPLDCLTTHKRRTELRLCRTLCVLQRVLHWSGWLELGAKRKYEIREQSVKYSPPSVSERCP